MSVTKPAPWAVSPGMVDPSWQWAWRDLRWILDAGRQGPAWTSRGWAPFTSITTRVIKGAPTGLAAVGSSGSVKWLDVDGAFTLGDEDRTFVWHGGDWTGSYNPRIHIGYRRDALDNGNWQCEDDNGSAVFNFYADGTQYLATWAGVSIPIDDGLDHVIAITRKVGGTYELWIDGVSQGEQTQAQAPNAVGGDDISFGSAENVATRSPGGYMSIAYSWDRVLTDGELALLARDPFGPIRPSHSFSRDAIWQDLNPTLRAIPGAADGA